MKQQSLLPGSQRWSLALVALMLCFGLISCNKDPNQADVAEPSSDPAQANLAAADQQQSGYAAPQTSATPAQAPAYRVPARANQSYAANPAANETYPAQSAPAQSAPATTQQPYAQDYEQSPNQAYGQTYDQGGQAYPVDYAANEQPVEADQPPPPLPVYTQPQCPGENYLWTPGYWAYAPAGYFWVPGAWVVAPYVGALWTPPYWGFAGKHYRWHHGFWGQHIGFYGGINYGFGYFGRGYEGGYWDRERRVFNYNRSVNNVNITVVHNVYNYRVVNRTTIINNTRISYNGGRGGVEYRPSPQEMAVLHEQRIAPVQAQVQHMRQAEVNRAQFASLNGGRPPMMAAARPLATAYREPAPHIAAVPEARPLPQVTTRPQTASPAGNVAQNGTRPGFSGNPALAGREHAQNPVNNLQQPNEPVNRQSALPARPEDRAVPQPAAARTAERMPQTQAAPLTQQRFEDRGATRLQQEQRTAPQQRVETQRVEPQRAVPQHTEQQHVQPQPGMVQRAAPQAQPRTETTPQPKFEQRPAPQERFETQRVEPQRAVPRHSDQQHVQPQPGIEQHAAPQAQPRTEPTSQPRSEQRPAPPPRAEPAPQPHVEQHPAVPTHQEAAPAARQQGHPAPQHTDGHEHERN